MKIAHILAAIEVSSLEPSSYPAMLMNHWVTARFGEDMVGRHQDRWELGSRMLKMKDFTKEPSGFTDNQFVLFPLELLPSTAEGLRGHLPWMLVASGNGQIVSEILRGINGATKTAHKGKVPALKLDRLADDLAQTLSEGSPAEVALTQALLTGELHRVKTLAAMLTPEEEKLATRRVREMYMIWAFFDLQIIACRYFHAEWNALEAGWEHPDLVKHSTVQALATNLVRMARELEMLFAQGASGADLSPKLRAFVEDNGLEALAKKNGASMGFTPEELKTGVIPASRRAEIARYLTHVRKEGEALLERYVAHGASYVSLRIDKANYWRRSRESNFALLGMDTRWVFNLTASSERFSMSTLLGLVYSVDRVVATMAALPITADILKMDGSEAGAAALLSRKAQIKLKEVIFPVYRHLFTRDHAHTRRTDAEYRQEADASRADVFEQPRTSGNKLWQKQMGVGLTPEEILNEPSGPNQRLPQMRREANRLHVYRVRDEPEDERAIQDRWHESSLLERLSTGVARPTYPPRRVK
jgi:hypothetical protein